MTESTIFKKNVWLSLNNYLVEIDKKYKFMPLSDLQQTCEYFLKNHNLMGLLKYSIKSDNKNLYVWSMDVLDIPLESFTIICSILTGKYDDHRTLTDGTVDSEKIKALEDLLDSRSFTRNFRINFKNYALFRRELEFFDKNYFERLAILCNETYFIKTMIKICMDDGHHKLAERLENILDLKTNYLL